MSITLWDPAICDSSGAEAETWRTECEAFGDMVDHVVQSGLADTETMMAQPDHESEPTSFNTWFLGQRDRCLTCQAVWLATVEQVAE